MAERKSLSKKLRFEVFKRDSFTCQYCGSKAPDKVLEIDHIQPVSKGGKNELMNLITSCFDCNRGKSNRKISDKSVVEKQRVQIEELNLRRQQLEMILEWKTGLNDIKSEEVEKVMDYMKNLCDHKYTLSDFGIKKMKTHLKKFGLQSILESIDIAFDKYYDDTIEGHAKAINKVPAIAYMNTQPKHVKDIAYIKGILRNRVYCNDKIASEKLLRFHQLGGNLQSVLEYAKVVKHWTLFIEQVDNSIEQMEHELYEDGLPF